MVGIRTLFGQNVEVAVIATLELVDGRIRIVRRKSGGERTPRPPGRDAAVAAQLFTVRIDPGSLPLQVTPTKLRPPGRALEVSGEPGSDPRWQQRRVRWLRARSRERRPRLPSRPCTGR